MTIENMTPDSAVLKQLDGMWQKLFMVLLHKTSGKATVSIGPADFEALTACCGGELPTLFTHGHANSTKFRIIGQTEAVCIRDLAENPAQGSA